MSLPVELRSVVDEVIRKSGLDGDTARRLRQDLEQHFRDGLAAGKTPDELLARFGNPSEVGPTLAAIPRRRHWRALGDGVIGSVLRDLRYASRALIKNPALTVTATVVLALGVSANAVVFTVVNELLLRPLPVEEPSSLVDVWPDIAGGNGFLGFAYEDFLTYRESALGLEHLVAFTADQFELGEGEVGEEVVAQLVTPGYFELLGLSAALGRVSFSTDAQFGEQAGAVLSHQLWQRSFGSDPGVVGRAIRLDDAEATVIGVAPAGFTGHFIGFPTDMWLPITASDPLLPGFDPEDRSSKPLEMIGRLSPGVSAVAAQAAFNAVAEQIEGTYPEINQGHRVGVTPTTGVDHSLRPAVGVFVAILTAVSLLVLLIACLNVSSILLVRAMSRNREISIRLAIGAGRGRLLQQLLSEAAMLMLLGTGLGTVVAVQLNAALADLFRELSGGLGLDLKFDWRVLGLTAAVALVAAVLASWAPTWHLLRKDPAGALRSRSGNTVLEGRLRSVLVTGQVAVSVVLVLVTGLFVRALVAGANVDPGFDADRLGTFSLLLGVDDPMRGASALQREVVESLREIPGVEAVAWADGPVLGVARSPLSVEIAGVLPPPGQDAVVVDGRSVSDSYLATHGIALSAGRDISEADSRDGPRVAVVTEAFVQRYWPAGRAVGRTFSAGGHQVRVVGVAENARYLVQDETPDPLVYLSLGGRTLAMPQVTVRSQTPLALTSSVNDAVRRSLPGHRRVELGTPRQVLRGVLLPQRLGALLVGGMGLVALFLAAIGLYGLVQYTVARDTHELGVRIALGGRRLDVLWVVLRKGFVLVAVGIMIGTGLAALSTPWLSSFLAGVSPHDPLTYGSVIILFSAVALLASWLPARRAGQIAPTQALRGE